MHTFLIEGEPSILSFADEVKTTQKKESKMSYHDATAAECNAFLLDVMKEPTANDIKKHVEKVLSADSNRRWHVAVVQDTNPEFKYRLTIKELNGADEEKQYILLRLGEPKPRLVTTPGEHPIAMWALRCERDAHYKLCPRGLYTWLPSRPETPYIYLPIGSKRIYQIVNASNRKSYYTDDEQVYTQRQKANIAYCKAQAEIKSQYKGPSRNGSK
jgi:hypothetical protein